MNLLEDLYDEIEAKEKTYLYCNLNVFGSIFDIKIESSSYNVSIKIKIDEPVYMQDFLNLFVKFKALQKKLEHNNKPF